MSKFRLNLILAEFTLLGTIPTTSVAENMDRVASCRLDDGTQKVCPKFNV